MSYVPNETIQYVDINKFATGSTLGTVPDPTLININSLWGIGKGNVGYGQSDSLPIISTTKLITATDWLPLANILNLGIQHQTGSTSNLVPLPAKNSTVAYNQGYVDRLKQLWDSRLNASANQLSTAPFTMSTTNIYRSARFIVTVTFPNANNARYFFNCGGQLKINITQLPVTTPTTSSTNFKTLFDQTGSLYISAPTANQTAVLNNNSYTGFTQVTSGSVATRTTYDTTGGYYGLSIVDKLLYKMTIANTPNTFISVSARTNGPQTLNGDNGNIITLTVVYNNTSLTEIVPARPQLALAAIFPSTSYLTNTWGTPTVTGAIN